MQQMNNLHPGLPDDLARFQAAFGSTLFIHLTRANKLEQAISYVKASQTGLWHKSPDGTELERLSAPKDPVYDAEAIAGHMAEMAAWDREWNDWFARARITPVRLNYDALSADPSGTLAKILDTLGLATGSAQSIVPAVAKLADATSCDWAKRFAKENTFQRP
jgi:LPS sulfotransferase NodH